MQKYFISDDDFNNHRITSDDVHHIKDVMRFNIGDDIIVSNGKNEAICKITSIDKGTVTFDITMAIQNENELPFSIDLYQGYPKGDKLEDIVKHTTELGVCGIYGVITRRSVFKLDSKKKESKIERFNKIAKEAAEQSNRKILPKFVDIIDFKKLNFSEYDYKIVCYEESAKNGEQSNLKNIIKNLKRDSRVAVFIGPEGGISEDEIKSLEDMGFVCCALGPRILRTETASHYVLSAISYEWELI